MTVSASSALAIAVYLLVADGLAALFLGGLLGGAGLALAAAAVAASWWQAPLRRRIAPQPWLGTAIVVLAAGGVALEVVTVAASMLDAFTHLLLFLLLVKLYTRRTSRDARDLAFLAFFMLVAVAPATTSVVFLALFVVFLVVGTWLLMLRHLVAEGEGAPPSLEARRPFGLGRDLFALSLAASAATIAITTVLFLVIPRVGQAALPLRPHVSRMVSGFSERVELGAFGEIEAGPRRCRRCAGAASRSTPSTAARGRSAARRCG